MAEKEKGLKMITKIIGASLLASVFMLVGCGGSSSDVGSTIPIVDNSTLADGESMFGYYGTDVVFGETLIVGTWTLDLEARDSIWTYDFTDDGQQIVIGGLFDTSTGDYGVSGDGTQFHSAGDQIIRIVNKLSGNCYNVENYDRFDGSLYTSGTFCKI